MTRSKQPHGGLVWAPSKTRQEPQGAQSQIFYRNAKFPTPAGTVAALQSLKETLSFAACRTIEPPFIFRAGGWGPKAREASEAATDGHLRLPPQISDLRSASVEPEVVAKVVAKLDLADDGGDGPEIAA